MSRFVLGAEVRKRTAILGSALFFLAAPGFLAGLVPWWLTYWWFEPAFFALPALRFAGALLAAAGLWCLVNSFAKFALEGRGTPAPIAPPSQLVVGGYYRYVRNPMYVAVVAIILGQAMLFGSLPLVAYGGLVWFGFAAFVMGYEEPTLQETFGADYEKFRANVPRWIPRLTPWKP